MATRFLPFLLFAFFIIPLAISSTPPEPSPSPSPDLPADSLPSPASSPSPASAPTSPSPAIASPSLPPSDSPISSPPAPPPSDLDSTPPSSPSPDNSEVPSPSPSPSELMSDINHSNNVEAGDVEEENGSSGMNGGKKAGVAVGVISAAVVVGVGALVYKKRQDNIRRSQYGYAARRELL
ncbi:vegetative cell wall protein gp1-like [Euphorbia lathyris]|uniref:vegetative cell wall protein gp1-like n=1 Tax=Euphorbia lathyris TaxID=212925 RepID=UPI003313E45C